MSLRALTFDLWATLIDSPRRGSLARHRYRVAALQGALADAGAIRDEETITAAMMEEWAHYKVVWREESRTMRNPERVHWLTVALEAPSLPDDAVLNVAQAFDDSLWEGPPGLSDGAIAELEAIRARGLRLGLISDTSFSTGRTLRRLLANHGLLEHFDVLTFSDEIGRSKPHARPFELTLEALAVSSPGDVIHVGDNEHTDITGARMMGMRTVRFTGCVGGDDAADSQADAVIDALPRLLQLLDH